MYALQHKAFYLTYNMLLGYLVKFENQKIYMYT